MRSLIDYLGSVKAEMLKVSWPSKDEVVSATSLVVVFAMALSLIVFGFDKISSRILELIVLGN